MSLTEKEVRKIAHLSRIKLNDEQVAHFREELSGIMDWIEMLHEVNTNNVPCMASVSNIGLFIREDEVTDGNCREDILANTESQYGCFVVPKVIE